MTYNSKRSTSDSRALNNPHPPTIIIHHCMRYLKRTYLHNFQYNPVAPWLERRHSSNPYTFPSTSHLHGSQDTCRRHFCTSLVPQHSQRPRCYNRLSLPRPQRTRILDLRVRLGEARSAAARSVTAPRLRPVRAIRPTQGATPNITFPGETGC